MVLTQKEIAKIKKTPIKFAEDNPKRLHMSKKEVLIEKAKEANIDLKVEEYKEKLKAEQVAEDLKEVDVDEKKCEGREEPLTEVGVKIAALKKQIDEEKGPGSHIRKKKLQEEIDELSK